MRNGKRYGLDANVFIQAHQRYYGFDIGPGFWIALSRHHDAKRIYSIDKVKDELLAGHDALSGWVTDTAPKTFFKGTADKAVSDQFKEMVNWVQSNPQFTIEAKAKFAAAADGWLISYAKVNDLIVVTHEEFRPDVKTNVPIPNVCREFGVEYCNTFELLRDLKVKLTLKGRRAAK